MSFPVCAVAREPLVLNTQYPLSDFVTPTREPPERGALIRFIPPPPQPERDLVFAYLTYDVIYPFESDGDPDYLLQIYGLWLSEDFETIMRSKNEGVRSKLLVTDTPPHVMRQIGQSTSNKMAVVAKNFLAYYQTGAESNVGIWLAPFIPASCVHLIQAYMA
jgi:hypothetical protein